MDARVIRTRHALQQALFELMQETRWEKIRVQDLLNRTGISRSTFYAHYDNKLDVLTSEIPGVMRMITIEAETSRLDLLGLFEHADEMASVFAPLLSQPVLGDISTALERAFAAAFSQVIDGDTSPALADFLAGGMLTTIRRYVTSRPRPPAHVIAAEVESYLRPLLTPRRQGEGELAATRPPSRPRPNRSP